MFGKTSAFSAASVYHMRTLAEDGKLSRDADEMLKFRGHMVRLAVQTCSQSPTHSHANKMIDSLFALTTGKTVPL